LYDIVTENDKKSEKSLITDFLFELYLFLDKNESIKSVEDFFKDNLKYNSTTNTFYIEDNGITYYSNSNSDYFKNLFNQKVNTFSGLNISNISEIKKV
jgi:hypothetical protein